MVVGNGESGVAGDEIHCLAEGFGGWGAWRASLRDGETGWSGLGAPAFGLGWLGLRIGWRLGGGRS